MFAAQQIVTTGRLLALAVLARVIEIATPRRSTCDARRYHFKLDPRIPLCIRKRAHTSPIWYTP